MTDGKTSEAQRKASREWEKRNPERTKYLRYRSNARHWATKEDINEIIEIFQNENSNAK